MSAALAASADCEVVQCGSKFQKTKHMQTYSGLENRCEATVFEHAVDVTLQGVGMALSACRER